VFGIDIWMAEKSLHRGHWVSVLPSARKLSKCYIDVGIDNILSMMWGTFKIANHLVFGNSSIQRDSMWPSHKSDLTPWLKNKCDTVRLAITIIAYKTKKSMHKENLTVHYVRVSVIALSWWVKMSNTYLIGNR